MNKVFFSILFLLISLKAADRPNILWIVAEDMSPVLGCYGDKYALTPHIDALCEKSIKYTNAFASAPICSPSRACLINGLPATSQGTHHMRSAFSIPAYMNGFPALLRAAGYYTTNNVKTDYNSANSNSIIQACWDENSATADWSAKNRDTPFFCIMNLMTSHQSRAMVWPYEKFVSEIQSQLNKSEIHDPLKAALPPYYVDTPVVRKTVARFYDCVTVMDKQLGTILKKLKDDGLAEDTIVFFYSDHGSGLPRHKRALLDSGMKIPLMIHFPKKFQHLSALAQGVEADRLISFADFAPTVLKLAGLGVPKYMQGRDFFSEQTQHEYVYGHRDRVDEATDLSRSIRDKRYLYIRNFMPFLSYNQPTAWPDLGEIRHEFYKHTDKSTMTAAQWHFAGPRKALEELYDTQNDPLNLNNLAASTEHQQVLTEMSGQLRRQLIESKDLGFIPESQLQQLCLNQTAYDMIRGNYKLADLVDAAFDLGVGAQGDFIKNLSSSNAALRYWAVLALRNMSILSESALQGLNAALEDKSAAVRVEAASALLNHAASTRALKVLSGELNSANLSSLLHTVRTLELLGDKAVSLLPKVGELDVKMKQLSESQASAADKDMAMFIGFSSGAYISKYGEKFSKKNANCE